MFSASTKRSRDSKASLEMNLRPSSTGRFVNVQLIPQRLAEIKHVRETHVKILRAWKYATVSASPSGARMSLCSIAAHGIERPDMNAPKENTFFVFLSSLFRAASACLDENEETADPTTETG